MITCGYRHSSELSHSFSIVVASLCTRSFIYPTHLIHRPLIENYAHAFHHQNERNTLAHRTLRILFYCDDNTCYTAYHFLAQIFPTSNIPWGVFSVICKALNDNFDILAKKIINVSLSKKFIGLSINLSQ